jgi:hypothetical protein
LPGRTFDLAASIGLKLEICLWNMENPLLINLSPFLFSTHSEPLFSFTHKWLDIWLHDHKLRIFSSLNFKFI